MDAGNERVRDLISRWKRLGLSQKDLAMRLDVHEATVSHIANEPERAVSKDLVDRMSSEVEIEEARRVEWVPLEVEAFCDSEGLFADAAARAEAIGAVRKAMMNPDKPLKLPGSIGATLVRIGGPTSRVYVVAIATSDTDSERRALAHELEHIRDQVLSAIKPTRRPPRGSF